MREAIIFALLLFIVGLGKILYEEVESDQQMKEAYALKFVEYGLWKKAKNGAYYWAADNRIVDKTAPDWKGELKYAPKDGDAP